MSEEEGMKQTQGSIHEGLRAFATLSILILVVTAPGTAGKSFAQPMAPDQPLHFRFVGEFYEKRAQARPPVS